MASGPRRLQPLRRHPTMQFMVCTKCGAAMPADAEFCSACGTQVIRIRQAPSIGWNPESNKPVSVAEPEYDDAKASVAPSMVVVPHELVYAGFWLRAIAYLIDMFLVALLAMPLLALLTPLAGNH
jgi:ribosomal protein L40E